MTCDPGDVHVWRIALDEAGDSGASLELHLTPDERERAGRFRFDADRRRWSRARAALRVVLARYAGCEPGGLRFELGAFGKPALSAPREALAFNITHTGDVALLALGAAGFQLGIDAEFVRPNVDWSDLSRRFFHPDEARDIHALAAAGQLDAFFTCWTRKEAFVKALGAGLSMPLEDFCVSVLPTEPPAVLTIRGDPHPATQWRLIDLREPGLAATLAVDMPNPTLRRFDFDTGDAPV